jgi:large subunit ribosomal protein L21
VDKLDVADGGTIELDRVLLIADGDKIKVGTPTIEGAKVVATSQGQTRGKKTIVYKFKAKVRYRRKTGHRQLYTGLVVDRIVGPEAAAEQPGKSVRRRKKEVKENGA